MSKTSAWVDALISDPSLNTTDKCLGYFLKQRAASTSIRIGCDITEDQLAIAIGIGKLTGTSRERLITSVRKLVARKWIKATISGDKIVDLAAAEAPGIADPTQRKQVAERPIVAVASEVAPPKRVTVQDVADRYIKRDGSIVSNGGRS